MVSGSFFINYFWGCRRLNLQELTQLKEGTKQELEQKVRIIVGMGTCGVKAGAEQVLAALTGEIVLRGLKDVEVVPCGCKGLCSHEPLVEVRLPGKPAVMYRQVSPARVRKIVAQHVVNCLPVREWTV